MTLDTTRADHLGCYGYARPTSPNLDALARESLVFTRARSTSSWTLPAHASLFTGKFPKSHGAHYDPEGPLLLADAIEAPRGIRARGLSADEETLAVALSRSGYATAAVVAGPWLLRGFGLSAGFEHYDDEGVVDHAGRSAKEVSDAARRWLLEERDRPFFLFLNYFDPHFPYDPPEPHASAFLLPGATPDPNRREQFEALYDGEIRFMDQEIGRLLHFLRDRGLYDETLIVVTSDHGELFGEHGHWGHSGHLFEELVRVPLLWKPSGPTRPGSRDERPVQLPELFDWIRAAARPGSGGMPEPGVPSRRPQLAEVHPITSDDARGGWRALWEGRYKLHESTLGRHKLFDLERDPGERSNLFARDPETATRLSRRLREAFEALPDPPPASPPLRVDAETREALDRLGYLE